MKTAKEMNTMTVENIERINEVRYNHTIAAIEKAMEVDSEKGKYQTKIQIPSVVRERVINEVKNLGYNVEATTGSWVTISW